MLQHNYITFIMFLVVFLFDKQCFEFCKLKVSQIWGDELSQNFTYFFMCDLIEFFFFFYYYFNVKVFLRFHTASIIYYYYY